MRLERCRPFRRKYTEEDIRLLAETDNPHGRLSGPATRKLMELAEEYRRHIASSLLPLNPREIEFLDGVMNGTGIESSLLTSDPMMQERIEANPQLLWKV